MKKITVIAMVIVALFSSVSVEAARKNKPVTNTVVVFTDLGLPSGTLWCPINENGFFSYPEAVSKYGEMLPTKDQWEELKMCCTWNWSKKGYVLTGPNGNTLDLPADGYVTCEGSTKNVGSFGKYWSSTANPYNTMNAWMLDFEDEEIFMDLCYHCCKLSIRLVQVQ